MLFILMMTRQLLSWKLTWKCRAPFQLRENLGGLTAIVCQSWLLLAVTHLLLSPLLSQVLFPKGNRSSKPSFSLLPVPISAPLMTRSPWCQLSLGTFIVGVAKSNSSHVSKKPWSCWEGWWLDLLYLLLPCLAVVLSYCPRAVQWIRSVFLCLWWRSVPWSKY